MSKPLGPGLSSDLLSSPLLPDSERLEVRSVSVLAMRPGGGRPGIYRGREASVARGARAGGRGAWTAPAARPDWPTARPPRVSTAANPSAPGLPLQCPRPGPPSLSRRRRRHRVVARRRRVPRPRSCRRSLGPWAAVGLFGRLPAPRPSGGGGAPRGREGGFRPVDQKGSRGRQSPCARVEGRPRPSHGTATAAVVGQGDVG